MSESSAITAALGAGLGALAGMVFGGWLTLRSARREAERVMEVVDGILAAEQAQSAVNQVAGKIFMQHDARLRGLEAKSHLAQPRTAGGRFAKKGGE